LGNDAFVIQCHFERSEKSYTLGIATRTRFLAMLEMTRRKKYTMN